MDLRTCLCVLLVFTVVIDRCVGLERVSVDDPQVIRTEDVGDDDMMDFGNTIRIDSIRMAVKIDVVSIYGKVHGEWNPKMNVIAYSKDGTIFGTFVKMNGDFEIHNLPRLTMDSAQYYTLSIVNANELYHQIRVSFDNHGNLNEIHLLEHPISRVIATSVADGIHFYPIGPVQFKEPQQSIDILPYLKNPIVIAMILCVLMVLLLPRLADFLDEETYTELTGDLRPPFRDPTDMFRALTQNSGTFPDQTKSITHRNPSATSSRSKKPFTT
mmetsp:Transcript_13527/g.24246  ORF Transcript_13527/g.24246 Transcript_13527/m.24246 type:complete len:270 (+) Transcript_13527:45-854(+)